MKKYISISAFLALVLTGCSQKTVEIETTTTTPIDEQSSGGTEYTQRETTTTDITDNIITEVDLSQESRDLNSQEISDKDNIKSVFFDFDQFSIRADMQEIVVNNTNIFKEENNANYTIKIEGNCDEWGTDEYNYALGLKRAKSVKDSLVITGIDASRVDLVSYGESNPTCQKHSRDCWAQNRRVDFKLIP